MKGVKTEDIGLQVQGGGFSPGNGAVSGHSQ